MDFDVTTLRGRRASQRWNRMAVGDILERLTWAAPDEEAIVGWEGAFADPRFERLTVRQADEAANRVAHALAGAGLRPGDRVLLYCDNSIEAVVTFMGIAKAGMVAVPVNPLMATDVLTWAIGHTGARYAITDAELHGRGAAAFEAAGLMPAVTIPIGGDAAAGTVSFHDWIAEQPASEPDVEIHADDIVALLFTSGTTSLPKAVMVSHTYAYQSAHSYALTMSRGMRFESDLRICTFLPVIFHIGSHATFLGAWLAGGSAVIGRRPNAPGTAAAIDRERATALWAGSPLLLEALADAAEADPALDLTSMTVMLFSWMTMHPDLVARLKALCGADLGLVEVFGQTEAASSFRFWLDQWPQKVASSGGMVNHVGAPNPLVAADIVDVDGASLRGRPRVPGEAVFRSPAITAGYYRDEPATREAFRDGWFHSGDSCLYEEDGQQVLVDRYKDIVKSGGENVSSSRVESVVAQHPDVARAAVIGLPDRKWGELVAAVIVPAGDGAPDEQGIIAFCRERLAAYEAPKRIIVTDEMPQTVGGKILKYRLRERYADALA